MKGFAIIIASVPVLMLAYSAWGRAYRILRQNAREESALKLAKGWPPYARAYATVQKLGNATTPEAPWHRPESSGRHVYIMGGGA